VERGSVQARATISESEAMPLHYEAELFGIGGDDERSDPVADRSHGAVL
jgi:hypothetical protein